MPKRNYPYILALLRGNPDLHAALRELEPPPQPKKVRPPNPRWKLMAKYCMRDGAKRCRQQHRAYVWRQKAPKVTGVAYYCRRCMILAEEKAARIAALNAKAEAEGRQYTYRLPNPPRQKVVRVEDGR